MGAWIETPIYSVNRISRSLSHPVWVRGLKHRWYAGSGFRGRESHPVWVRGLKRSFKKPLSLCFTVAPRVGAWIETSRNVLTDTCSLSHPVWVRGLKPFIKDAHRGKAMSHPVWVRGLKLRNIRQPATLYVVAPRVGAWIETFDYPTIPEELDVAPRVGAWIETSGYASTVQAVKGRTPCGCVD